MRNPNADETPLFPPNGSKYGVEPQYYDYTQSSGSPTSNGENSRSTPETAGAALAPPDWTRGPARFDGVQVGSRLAASWNAVKAFKNILASA